MYLCIASQDRNHFDVILFDADQKKENQQKEYASLLDAVDAFLQEQCVLKQDIEGIMVVVGLGTFSTTRAGTVLANAWSLTQKIPVLAISPQQVLDIQKLIPLLLEHQGLVLPEYNSEPNIRLKKSDSV